MVCNPNQLIRDALYLLNDSLTSAVFWKITISRLASAFRRSGFELASLQITTLSRPDIAKGVGKGVGLDGLNEMGWFESVGWDGMVGIDGMGSDGLNRWEEWNGRGWPAWMA